MKKITVETKFAFLDDVVREVVIIDRREDIFGKKTFFVRYIVDDYNINEKVLDSRLLFDTIDKCIKYASEVLKKEAITFDSCDEDTEKCRLIKDEYTKDDIESLEFDTTESMLLRGA